MEPNYNSEFRASSPPLSRSALEIESPKSHDSPPSSPTWSAQGILSGLKTTFSFGASRVGSSFSEMKKKIAEGFSKFTSIVSSKVKVLSVHFGRISRNNQEEEVLDEENVIKMPPLISSALGDTFHVTRSKKIDLEQERKDFLNPENSIYERATNWKDEEEELNFTRQKDLAWWKEHTVARIEDCQQKMNSKDSTRSRNRQEVYQRIIDLLNGELKKSACTAESLAHTYQEARKLFEESGFSMRGSDLTSRGIIEI